MPALGVGNEDHGGRIVRRAVGVGNLDAARVGIGAVHVDPVVDHEHVRVAVRVVAVRALHPEGEAPAGVGLVVLDECSHVGA